MITIRPERPDDLPTIRQVNNLAFGRSEEAQLVDRLRENCRDLISLVALAEDHLVGHILFTPVNLNGTGRSLVGTGLGPLAVRPDYQQQGIGSTLVRQGIENVMEQGSPFIVVLGHSTYYPRFGFEPAGRFGIRSQWKVPNHAFMILVLDETAMRGLSCLAEYQPEFSE
jgi:putative acetyltransferase